MIDVNNINSITIYGVNYYKQNVVTKPKPMTKPFVNINYSHTQGPKSIYIHTQTRQHLNATQHSLSLPNPSLSL